MTENEIYSIIRPWTLPHGKMLRVENTVSTGTVDAIMFYKGMALMMEFKVIRSNKIKVRPFQLATAAEYTKEAIPDNQYNFVCSGDNDPGMRLYPFSKLQHAPYTPISKDEVQISIKNIQPTFVWNTREDFNTWVCQFKKKVTYV